MSENLRNFNERDRLLKQIKVDNQDNRFRIPANILERLITDLQCLVLVDRLCFLMWVNLALRYSPSSQIFVV
jgi:hypothetical protein